MPDHELKEAMALARGGKKSQARHILIGLLKTNPYNELAWLWLAECMSNDQERIQILERCLTYLPNSETARRGIKILQSVPEDEEPIAAAEEPRQTWVVETPPPDGRETPPIKPAGGKRPRAERKRRGSCLPFIVGLVGIFVLIAAATLGFTLLQRPAPTPAPNVIPPSPHPVTVTPYTPPALPATYTPTVTVSPLPSVTPTVSPTPNAALPQGFETFKALAFIPGNLEVVLVHANGGSQILPNALGASGTAFSPDGQRIAYRDNKDLYTALRGGIQPVNVLTSDQASEQLKLINSSKAVVGNFAWLPDSNGLIVEIQIPDLTNPEILGYVSINLENGVVEPILRLESLEQNKVVRGNSLIDPNGDFSAVISSTDITIIDLQTGAISRAVIKINNEFNPLLAWNKNDDGKLLAAIFNQSGIGAAGSVTIYQVTNGLKTNKIADLPDVRLDFLSPAITFSDDQSLLAAASSGAVFWFNLEDGHQNTLLDAPGIPLAWSPDSARVAIFADSGQGLVIPLDGQQQTFGPQGMQILKARWVDDQTLLYLGLQSKQLKLIIERLGSPPVTLVEDLRSKNNAWSANQYIQLSFSLAPEGAPRPAVVPAPKSSSAIWGIPGLNADSAAAYLTGSGLSCLPANQEANGAYTRYCSQDLQNGITLDLSLKGKSGQSVESLSAKINFPGNPASPPALDEAALTRITDALRKVAELPYSGSQPTEAGAWTVENALAILNGTSQQSQQTFGDANLALNWAAGLQLEYRKPE